MVLPVMRGGDVGTLLRLAPDNRLLLEQVLAIVRDVCGGLEFAHTRNVVHRDLKPGNVWLTEDGTARIGDFGLAIGLDMSRLTTQDVIVGTASYMSPEQAMGEDITPRSDLYSLGCMLYEIVCGKPPFVGDSPITIINQQVSTVPVAPGWHTSASRTSSRSNRARLSV